MELGLLERHRGIFVDVAAMADVIFESRTWECRFIQVSSHDIGHEELQGRVTIVRIPLVSRNGDPGE